MASKPIEAGDAYIPCTLREPPDLSPYHLNGTQDMLALFDLMPLYDCAVRPYLRPTLPPDATDADKAAAQAKRVVMPKTYAHYVEDLPGKVRPARKSQSKQQQPALQRELNHILMKPEFTYTPVQPLEKDVLTSAFSVQPTSDPIPGIDLTLLEADEHDSPGARKNKLGLGDRPDAPKKRVVLISKKKRM
ncbi:RNA polymerase II transcription regulator [Malassezia pachydermatis]|uniref:Mediator of RNA polymerase II transcription subunit 19 n=1 Tax=Malassezia pachydermatis TaxID=77020 RepID=A0A0M8MWT1_9BASI|nr:hypothetical protein Malapachy_2455 [Malassezia pachydermatis]KOS15360.1 hypothetical protein Malapachy_2455 [Malassezia pachydermatis]